MEQCIALADYNAVQDDEISFRRGDLINVTLKGGASGYWEGFVSIPASVAAAAAAAGKVSPDSRKKLKLFGGAADAGEKDAVPSDEGATATGKRGLFPNCFVTSNVQPRRAPTFCDKVVALYSYTARVAGEMSFEKGDLMTILRPSSSVGWWLGINETGAMRRKERGDPPSSIEAAHGSSTSPLMVPSNFVTSNIVIVAYAFTARQNHELPCDVGDVIIVHRRWNDGWWEGTLKGRRGIFPSNYTLPNVATTTPPFFCNRCKGILQFFSGGATPVCKSCAKDEEITRSMLTALKDYDAGVLDRLDLFAYVDIDPTSSGKATLLSEADLAGKSVRRNSRKTASSESR